MVFLWRIKLRLSEKRLPHISQAKGFSPECVRKWTKKSFFLFLGKLLPHTSQSKLCLMKPDWSRLPQVDWICNEEISWVSLVNKKVFWDFRMLQESMLG